MQPIRLTGLWCAQGEAMKCLEVSHVFLELFSYQSCMMLSFWDKLSILGNMACANGYRWLTTRSVDVSPLKIHRRFTKGIQHNYKDTASRIHKVSCFLKRAETLLDCSADIAQIIHLPITFNDSWHAVSISSTVFSKEIKNDLPVALTQHQSFTFQWRLHAVYISTTVCSHVCPKFAYSWWIICCVYRVKPIVIATSEIGRPICLVPTIISLSASHICYNYITSLPITSYIHVLVEYISTRGWNHTMYWCL